MTRHAETIRAALRHTSAFVWGAPDFRHPDYCKGCKANAALDRLLTRIEAAEQALREIADSKAYDVGKDGHGRRGVTPYEWARNVADRAVAAAREAEQTP